MDLENNLETIIIITNSGKKHRCMIKPAGGGLKNSRIIVSEFSSHDNPRSTKGKTVTLQWRNVTRHCFGQAVKLNIPSDKS